MIKVTKKKLDQGRLDDLVANARVSQEAKERGYRDRALKMYPWVCGR
ncbi:MAG: HNH endonuclease, partial [Gammaproteobacteria bacterium]|nr:HNH endonuclease [Gammaproteobacteria bacterium]